MATLQEEIARAVEAASQTGRKFGMARGVVGSRAIVALELIKGGSFGRGVYALADEQIGEASEDILPFIPANMADAAVSAIEYNSGGDGCSIVLHLGLRSEVMAWRRGLVNSQD